MDGFINILKPPGISSNQVVVKARKILGQKKIGHSGTLDPGAAGVLVLGVNKGTRLLEYLLDSDKQYRAELTFGIKTTTGDAFGDIVEKKKGFNVGQKELEKVLEGFKGQHLQTPPMTSAIKHQGKKLYELAREGRIVERKARLIEIRDIKLVQHHTVKGTSKAIFDVECSKGTYIRTLCEDIASKLDTVGYMSFLVRTQAGLFNINSSHTIEEIEDKFNKNKDDFICPLELIIDNKSFIKYTLNDSELSKVLNGSPIQTESDSTDKVIALFSEKKLVALGRNHDGIIKLNKVFK
ncbi:tRNA pseudouridine(55) synthase TruB [Desulfitibacter alkalitolerans]|uniref:tRNA pseudouridine(55) synthase TruB n=1 Tax=Desulfitibacter alkalitolerans TaxID=264641 RepID=UPI000482A8B4|nr:tRNA pseudouridine(55) synthase TruB [Desulfitibacter alkalitolerans]